MAAIIFACLLVLRTVRRVVRVVFPRWFTSTAHPQLAVMARAGSFAGDARPCARRVPSRKAAIRSAYHLRKSRRAWGVRPDCGAGASETATEMKRSRSLSCRSGSACLSRGFVCRFFASSIFVSASADVYRSFFFGGLW